MKLLEPEVPWVGDQEIADDEVVFSATREDLAGLASAFNEALEAVEAWERAPTPEIRKRIIDGRIRHLETEIRNFQDQIDKLLGGG